MKKIIITIFILLLLAISIFFFYFYKKEEISLKKALFSDLPGWTAIDKTASFDAFLVSCKPILRMEPKKDIGSKHIPLKAKYLIDVCKKATLIKNKNNKAVKKFFEDNFVPVTFYITKQVEGLFTGYYMPIIKASLTKTEKFNTPVYGIPRDLISVDLSNFSDKYKHDGKLSGRIVGNRLVPYFTRKQINNGAIKKSAKVLVWIESAIDRQFMEIQGSGIVELANGKKYLISYANENGAKYTSIASVLIKDGIMTKHNASMQKIKDYLKSHPKEMDRVLEANESFVFFERLNSLEAYGAMGVELTPGISLAVDKKWVPYGLPIWLNTTYPDKNKTDSPLRRLMIAQDTGGAIRGPVRGDVYWGSGEKAYYTAGHMKNSGVYWLLLPKEYAKDLPEK